MSIIDAHVPRDLIFKRGGSRQVGILAAGLKLVGFVRVICLEGFICVRIERFELLYY